METTIMGYIGIQENKMETTIVGLYRENGKQNPNYYNCAIFKEGYSRDYYSGAYKEFRLKLDQSQECCDLRQPPV